VFTFPISHWAQLESYLLLADGISKLLRADGTSKLIIGENTSQPIDGLQDISALGTLAGTDLMYGYRSGAPDEDFKVDIDTLKALLSKDGTVVGTATASASTEVIFENGVNGVVFDGTYKRYKLYASGIYITDSTTDENMLLRVKRSGQGSFDSIGGDYRYTNQGLIYTDGNPPSYYYLCSASSSGGVVIHQVSYQNTTTGCLEIECYDPSDATTNSVFSHRSSHRYAASLWKSYYGGTIRTSTDAIVAIRLATSTNRPFNGEFILIGYDD
jgi:hypothetical protein